MAIRMPPWVEEDIDALDGELQRRALKSLVRPTAEEAEADEREKMKKAFEEKIAALALKFAEEASHSPEWFGYQTQVNGHLITFSYGEHGVCVGITGLDEYRGRMDVERAIAKLKQMANVSARKAERNAFFSNMLPEPISEEGFSPKGTIRTSGEALRKQIAQGIRSPEPPHDIMPDWRSGPPASSRCTCSYHDSEEMTRHATLCPEGPSQTPPLVVPPHLEDATRELVREGAWRPVNPVPGGGCRYRIAGVEFSLDKRIHLHVDEADGLRFRLRAYTRDGRWVGLIIKLGNRELRSLVVGPYIGDEFAKAERRVLGELDILNGVHPSGTGLVKTMTKVVGPEALPEVCRLMEDACAHDGGTGPWTEEVKPPEPKPGLVYVKASPMIDGSIVADAGFLTANGVTLRCRFMCREGEPWQWHPDNGPIVDSALFDAFSEYMAPAKAAKS